MMNPVGSYDFTLLKREMLEIDQECQEKGFDLENWDAERLEHMIKVLHVAQENLAFLADLFTNEEKFNLVDTCRSLKAESSPTDMPEVINVFDRIINLGILSCRTDSEIKNAFT